MKRINWIGLITWTAVLVITYQLWKVIFQHLL